MDSVVGQVKIDFEVIPTYEIYTLWVGDSSDWKYLEDKESTIGIKVPNSTKELLFPFKKKSLNIFNSNDLGVSCFKSCAEQEHIPIPDGLYTIKVYSSSQYQNKERWFFKTDNLQLEVDKAFIKLGFEYKKEDEDYIKNLSLIDFFLKAVHSATRLGDQIKAQAYYEQAKELLKQYQNCKNCY